MNKKIKTLCLGALLGTSVFGFTGCNLFQQDLSQSQIDKLLYIADNADNFMDETMDLLKGANAKIDIDEARKLLEITTINLTTNKDGIVDNFIVDTGKYGKMYYYTDENDCRYYFETRISDDGEEELYRAVYDVIKVESGYERRYVYHFRDDDGLYAKYEITDITNRYSSALAYTLSNSLDFSELIDERFSINSVKVLENGNYLITAYATNIEADNNDEDYQRLTTTLVNYEVTPDEKLVSYKYNSVDYSKETGYADSAGYNTSVANFKYNEITKEQVQEFMTFINTNNGQYVKK